jgi:AhpD family alkylhydroperoxidase
MKNPLFVLPDALKALYGLKRAAAAPGLPDVTVKLVHLRASQVNGCSVCVMMHAAELKQAGQSDERIWAVSAWRETTYFTNAERAALGLAEYVTRLADRPDAVPDEVWDEARRHYDDAALSALILQIALINVFNRVNATVRQPYDPAMFAAAPKPAHAA